MDARQRAQTGVYLIKEAVLEVLRDRPEGLSNAEIASLLDIRSRYGKKSEDFLSWSILGLLLNEKKIQRNGRKYEIAQVRRARRMS
jgi:hypothetical protein